MKVLAAVVFLWFVHLGLAGVPTWMAFCALFVALGWAIAREIILTKEIVRGIRVRQREALPIVNITWEEFKAEPGMWFKEADYAEVIVRNDEHVMSIVRRNPPLEE